MPGGHAPGRVTYSVWIDRELRDAFREAVPEGQRRQVIEDAIRAAVDAAEQAGESRSATEENRADIRHPAKKRKGRSRRGLRADIRRG